MKQVASTIALAVLTAGFAGPCAWGADGAVVSGVVRDAHGVPQLGAVVELLSPDAAVLARAFTDDHGRYSLSTNLPGSYELRASAAFLAPVVRGNVRLSAGVRAVADLTMTAIFETGFWLPAEGRKAGEAADDWRWTLRSTGNRPMLRFVGDDSESLEEGVSSSEAHLVQPVAEGQLALMGGAGGFGAGGAHQILTLDRAEMDGGVSVLRANVGDAMAPGEAASVAVAAGMERKRAFGGETRIFASFSSNPELETSAGPGVEVLRTAASERIALGDLVTIDAGTLFTAERLFGNRFESAPYVRIAFRPSSAIAVEYRLATDRSLQRTEDLDQIAAPEQVLSDAYGRPILKRALHQEIAVSSIQEKRVVSVAVFRDAAPVVGVEGGGKPASLEFTDLPILADLSTGTFRFALPGYTGANGARLSWTEVLSPSISACIQGQLGTALLKSGTSTDLSELTSDVRTQALAALSAAVDAHSRRTGTEFDVRYRWQPERSLTQVDPFDTVPADAYLGMRMEQRLWTGRRIKGVKAVIEATNLLAQGYEPLLGPDGETLFLAQVPRSLHGGLAFSF